MCQFISIAILLYFRTRVRNFCCSIKTSFRCGCARRFHITCVRRGGFMQAGQGAFMVSVSIPQPGWNFCPRLCLRGGSSTLAYTHRDILPSPDPSLIFPIHFSPSTLHRYRIFLSYRPRLPCRFYLVVIEQQQQHIYT